MSLISEASRSKTGWDWLIGDDEVENIKEIKPREIRNRSMTKKLKSSEKFKRKIKNMK